MDTQRAWETTPATERLQQTRLLDGGEESEASGLLAQAQSFYIGTRAAAWLKSNEGTALSVADRYLRKAADLQSLYDSLMHDAECGIYPQVKVQDSEGAWIEADMSKLQFAEKMANLAVVVGTAVEKAVNIRNRAATGGTNLYTAALLQSAGMRLQAARRERSAHPAPRKRYGVDKLVIEGDAEVVEA